MKETGKVTKIENGQATVEIEGKEACSKCNVCKEAKTKTTIISGEKARQVKIGDHVEINIDSSVLLRVYALLYLIPLVIFVGSTLISYFIFNSPIKSFFIGCVCTGLGYMIVGRHIKKKEYFLPNVVIKRKKG